MTVELLLTLLVRILVESVGHEKARKMVSDEARFQAKLAADLVAAARVDAEKD